MAFQEISIKGYKSYSSKWNSIKLHLHDGTPGSGLNLFVGKNNTGKSTIFELLRLTKDIDRQNIDEEVVNYTSRSEQSDFSVKILSDTGDEFSFSSQLYTGDHKRHNLLVTQRTFNPQVYIVQPNRFIQKRIAFTSLRNRVSDGHNVNMAERRDTYEIIQEIEAMEDTMRSEFDLFINEFLPEIKKLEVKSSSRENSAKLYCELINGNQIDLQDMGSGIEQFVILLWVIRYGAKDHVLLIDEPEISLHPMAQIKLLRILIEQTKDRQIIMATHSPYFIEPTLIQNIYKFELNSKKETAVKSIPKSVQLSDKDLDILQLDFNGIFFTDKVICVEGKTDLKRFFLFYTSHGINLEDYLILKMNGKGETLKFKKILSVFAKNCKIILDLDAITASHSERGIKSVFTDFPAIHTKIATLNKKLRKHLKDDQLNPTELSLKNAILAELKKKSIYVLRDGQIEDYLDNTGSVTDTSIDKENELLDIINH